MAVWLLVQAAAGALMVALYRYQSWSVRPPNRRRQIRMDEGFGLSIQSASAAQGPVQRHCKPDSRLL
jgi:hypothetical protein